MLVPVARLGNNISAGCALFGALTFVRGAQRRPLAPAKRYLDIEPTIVNP